MQTRLFSTIAIAAVALAGSTAFAGTRAETSTYVDGNVTGVSPNTGGTLLLSDDKAMYFRTGLATVPVAYSSISHVELGAVKETSHDVPLYKVWALHKRFAGKTETQLLVINFKNEEGEEKNMTLELARASASSVLSAIQAHGVAAPEKTMVASADSTQKFAKRDKHESKKQPDSKKQPETTAAAKPEKSTDWWGDEYWRTNRNSDKWNAKTAGSNANDQR